VRHRVYDPELGRWTRRDPIGYVDGMGLYENVGSGVIGRIDSNGLAWHRCVMAGTFVGCVDNDLEDEWCKFKCNFGNTCISGFTECRRMSPSSTDCLPGRACVCIGNIIDSLTDIILPRLPNIDGPWKREVGPIEIAIVVERTRQHEVSHQQQCVGSRECRECEAYTQSVICLSVLRARCGHDKLCPSIIDAAIDVTSELADRNCAICDLFPSDRVIHCAW
jgi:hypothetical protein